MREVNTAAKKRQEAAPKAGPEPQGANEKPAGSFGKPGRALAALNDSRVASVQKQAIVRGLAQQFGNQQVQRMIKSMKSPPTIQRACGCAGSCKCQEEQKTTQTVELQRAIGDGHDLSSPRFKGDPKLEACYDDEDRLKKGDTGDSVQKVQQALLDLKTLSNLSYDLGPAGADSIYGPKTEAAVKKFKVDNSLTPSTYGDVGPKTMAKLDELFKGTPGGIGGGGKPPQPPSTPTCITAKNPDLSSPTINPTTDSEDIIALKHPIDAVRAKLAADDALDLASGSSLAGLHLGPADAFRHAYWNCIMTQRIGAIRAEQFATGHENSGPSPIPFDNQMDLHNNASGRKLGIPGTNCEAAAKSILAAGELRTIRGPDTDPQAKPPIHNPCIGDSSQPWP